MLITVSRHNSQLNRVLSRVLVDNYHVCYGLEPPLVAATPGGPEAVKAGYYGVALLWSNSQRSWIIAIDAPRPQGPVYMVGGDKLWRTSGDVLLGMQVGPGVLYQGDRAFLQVMSRIVCKIPVHKVEIAFENNIVAVTDANQFDEVMP